MHQRRISYDEIVTAAFDGCEQPQADDEVVHARKDGGSTKPVPPGKHVLRVLVADDSRDTADSLSMLLVLWGYDVRVAYAGVAALQLAFAYQPNVLLLDVAMPELNGYDLARRIRQEGRFDGALLVGITGYGDERHRLLGQEAGFDHYLIKPIELSSLEKLLRRRSTN